MLEEEAWSSCYFEIAGNEDKTLREYSVCPLGRRGHDVEAMRYIYKKLPKWNYSDAALDLWHLDQRINDRGVLVDLDMVDAAIRVVERERRRLARHTANITGGEVASTTQRDKLLVYLLAEHGVDLPDMNPDLWGHGRFARAGRAVHL